VQASSEPADFGIQDAVFICLKAYSIAAMLRGSRRWSALKPW